MNFLGVFGMYSFKNLQKEFILFISSTELKDVTQLRANLFNSFLASAEHHIPDLLAHSCHFLFQACHERRVSCFVLLKHEICQMRVIFGEKDDCREEMSFVDAEFMMFIS